MRWWLLIALACLAPAARAEPLWLCPFGEGPQACARVTQPFAARRSSGGYHAGVDLAASCGTPVLAPTRGVVVSARRVDGRVVLRVERPDGALFVAFDHLSEVQAAEGPVETGAVLGRVGSDAPGRACHLHLAARRGRSPDGGLTAKDPGLVEYLDPLALLVPSAP